MSSMPMTSVPMIPETYSHVLAEFECLNPLLSALRLDSSRLKVCLHHSCPNDNAVPLYRNIILFYNIYIRVVYTNVGITTLMKVCNSSPMESMKSVHWWKILLVVEQELFMKKS